ncbi:MAG: hypothetical protein ABI704_19395 [Kofleriaceae bacterium]
MKRTGPMFQSIISIVVLATCLGGCDKDAAAPPTGKVDLHDPMVATATRRKPCEYVKRADAEKAVGLPLPQTNENVTLGDCGYTTKEFYGSDVQIAGSWENCKQAGAGSRPPLQVAGVGDEAFFIREHLFIRKGERCLSVSINGPLPDADKDDGLARVKELALAILVTF